MEQKLVKTCSYALLIFVLAIGVVEVAANNNFVSAQSCSAQLGSPTTSTQQYYTSNFQVTVPVSTTCSFYAGQLYATGTAYDATYNSNVGTANTALSSTYGGNVFSGQLQFNLPTSEESHSVQFSVSIYSTQTQYGQGSYGGSYYGSSVLATTSATFTLAPNYYQNGYQNYPTYPSYPTYPTYPNNNYPSYPSYPNYPNNNYYYNNPYYQYQNPGHYYYYHNGGYYHYYNNGGYSTTITIATLRITIATIRKPKNHVHPFSPFFSPCNPKNIESSQVFSLILGALNSAS